MFKNVNLTRNICNHVIGENHTHSHRMICGTIFIGIGVLIAKAECLTESVIVQSVIEGFGYLIHGIGSIPYVELISKIGKNESDNKPTE